MLSLRAACFFYEPKGTFFGKKNFIHTKLRLLLQDKYL
jgi:hypothetical protein